MKKTINIIFLITKKTVKKILFLLRIIFKIPIFIFYKVFLKEVHFSTDIDITAKILTPLKIELGRKARIREGVVLQTGSSIKIGENTGVNPYTVIYGKVSIGKNCMIAPHVMLAGGSHNFNSFKKPMIKQKCSSKRIVIEENVWIGANAVVTEGITIKKGSIVGAGSVVTKDIGKNLIVAGVPAKVIGQRNKP